LTLLDREQQKPDLTAARSRPSSWEDHEPVAPPASHAGGEPSPTRTATPARTRHPPSPPPEPDPKPGRARPHLPRTSTFGAFSRPKAPPTRHDGPLSTSEQQKTRLPADLRPGSGYFVSSSATFSLALVGRQLTKIADQGKLGGGATPVTRIVTQDYTQVLPHRGVLACAPRR